MVWSSVRLWVLRDGRLPGTASDRLRHRHGSLWTDFRDLALGARTASVLVHADTFLNR